MNADKSSSGRVGETKIRPQITLRSRFYDVYLSDEYCLPCTYFIQEKGHFGQCVEKKSKIYDGAKKGTACALWRIKTRFIGLEEIKRPKLLVKQVQLQPRQRLGSIPPPFRSYHPPPPVKQLSKKELARMRRRNLKSLEPLRFFFKNIEKPPKRIGLTISSLSCLSSWINTLNLPNVTSNDCPFCHSKENVKIGLRSNQKTKIQRYQCKSCGHKFSSSPMRLKQEHVSSIITLRSQGYSYRNIAKNVGEIGNTPLISYVAVIKWVKKYVAWCLEHSSSP